MKSLKYFGGSLVAAGACFALAAQPAPVVEVGNAVATSSQLEKLERKLDARNRAQIQIQQQLDELQNEVSELRGVTELHSHQLNQILERQRELYQELDRRVSEAIKPATPVAQPEVTPTPGSQIAYSNNLNENDDYDRAVNLVLKDKRYEQAIGEFESFLTNFPQSIYAPNAHYWLGQLLFNKAEFGQAKGHFEKVVNNYLDSSKRSDSMLKLGMVAQKQNNRSQALNIYQQLVSEYPDSSAANLAKPRIEALNK
jgi:tol-pal system protein YbgF